MTACQHDVIYEVDYTITLDKENTYYAGEPVRFNITGNVENLVFYSGETGAQYVYKDRYSVPVEDVISANLHLDLQARYGGAGALEIYVSKDFAGIDGSNDPEGDLVAGNQFADAAEAVLLSAFGETGVVDGDGQILNIGICQRVDDVVGGAVAKEAADHNKVAVLDESSRLFCGDKLAHSFLFLLSTAGENPVAFCSLIACLTIIHHV